MQNLRIAEARRQLLLAACLAVACASPLGAQQLSPLTFGHELARPLRGGWSQSVPAERSTATLALAGAAGASGGILGGGVLGGALAFALVRCGDQDGCVDDYANWAFNGAAAGSSLLVPVSVHVANRRHGRAIPAVLASGGIGALGLGAFWSLQRSEAPDAAMAATIAATPLLQILASVVIERATSRRE